MIFLLDMKHLLFLLIVLVCVSSEDPSPVSYPGQVNVGLLADMRSEGILKSSAAHRAMAAVWAAAQENFAHPQQLNIGETFCLLNVLCWFAVVFYSQWVSHIPLKFKKLKELVNFNIIAKKVILTKWDLFY